MKCLHTWSEWLHRSCSGATISAIGWYLYVYVTYIYNYLHILQYQKWTCAVHDRIFECVRVRAWHLLTFDTHPPYFSFIFCGLGAFEALQVANVRPCVLKYLWRGPAQLPRCRDMLSKCLRRGTLVSNSCEKADARPESNAKELHCSLLVLMVERMSSEHQSLFLMVLRKMHTMY